MAQCPLFGFHPLYFFRSHREQCRVTSLRGATIAEEAAPGQATQHPVRWNCLRRHEMGGACFGLNKITTKHRGALVNRLETSKYWIYFCGIQQMADMGTECLHLV